MPEIIDLTYRAQLKDLTAALAKIDGMNVGLAKKLTNDLDRAYRDAARTAGASTKKMAADVSKAFASLRGASVAAFGPLGERLNHLSGVMEGIGASGQFAGAAVGVGMAAAAVAVVGVVSRAENARDRLEEMGLASLLPAAAVDGLTAYSEAVRGLSVSADVATVTLGGTFAPLVTEITDRLTGTTLAFRDLASGDIPTTTAAIRDLSSVTAEGVLAVATGGTAFLALGDAINYTGARADALKNKIAALTDETRGLDDETREQLVALGLLDDGMTAASGSTEAGTEAQNAYTVALQEGAAELAEQIRLEDALAKRRADATAGLRSIEAAAEAEVATQAEAIQAAYDARIAKIRELARETVDLDAVADATAAAEVARATALADLAEQTQERAKQAHEQALMDAEALRAAYASTLMGVTKAADAAFSVYSDTHAQTAAALHRKLTEGAEDMTDAERKEIEKRLAEQRRAALAGFRAAQAVQIAQAEMAAALSAVEAYASLVGIPLAGPVLAAAAAASAIAFGLAQAAAIAAQPTPVFHVGGMVDDVPATLQRGEAILSRRGRAIIGDEMIEAANRGTQPATMPQRVQALVVYQHRAFAAFLRDFAAGGGLLDLMPARSTPIAHRVR